MNRVATVILTVALNRPDPVVVVAVALRQCAPFATGRAYTVTFALATGLPAALTRPTSDAFAPLDTPAGTLTVTLVAVLAA
jgi:hypothetical protein